MSGPDVPKTYVRPDNTAVLTCTHCGQQRTIQAESFRGHKHRLQVRCLCRNHFDVFLEFRKRVRKKTLLRGTFVNQSNPGCVCGLVIRDLSVIGMTFTSMEAASLKEGDELSVRFNLDDEYRSEIRRDVVVMSVRQSGVVGAEIQISYGEHFSGPLGNYVSA